MVPGTQPLGTGLVVCGAGWGAPVPVLARWGSHRRTADVTMAGMDTSPMPPAAIAADLRRLGLRRGDVVMVHASLRAIGPVTGGADGVIDAILHVVGPGGTMLMVLGAANAHAWVDERPEPERVGLLADAEPFDAAITPAHPDVGVLAEVFRQRRETVVSDHPEGRFAAAGAAASRLLSDVPWDDYFGPGSPLERLVSLRGRILRLGADADTVTALHHAEYLTAAGPKRRVRRYRLVATPAGPQVRVVECLDDEGGIVDYEGEDYFARILRAYLESGAAARGLVGRAPSELLAAADMVAFGVRWMDRHLGAPSSWPVERLQARLEQDLLQARRHGRHAQVAAIRGLKSALANAEAVPLPERPFELVKGTTDVPRRRLGEAEVAGIIEREIAERHRAIDQYRALGVDTGSLEIELATLERYDRRP